MESGFWNSAVWILGMSVGPAGLILVCGRGSFGTGVLLSKAKEVTGRSGAQTEGLVIKSALCGGQQCACSLGQSLSMGLVLGPVLL